MVTGVLETVCVGGTSWSLGSALWHDGTIAPDGHRHLESFRLEGRIPVWTYSVPGLRLEKRVVMIHGMNETAVEYRLLEAPGPVRLHAEVHVTYRDHHATTACGDGQMDVRKTPTAVIVTAFPQARPLHIRGIGLSLFPEHTWHRRHLLSEERERGFSDFLEDDLHAATAEGDLVLEGRSLLVFSAEPEEPLRDAGDCIEDAARLDEETLRKAERASPGGLDGFSGRLALAASDFVVDRSVENTPGMTVLAGYPWFSDWGRDTMISLPGLTLATGRPEVAHSILLTFARFVSQGMIPNRFPDSGGAPEYNTVDATLWFIQAVRAYFEATSDASFARDLWPVLTGIVEAHRRGTRHGISVDPEDGLLRAGEPGVQLTWMDAKCHDWVVTPRHGKCVEINALWYNALVTLGALAREVNQPEGPWLKDAERVMASFSRFWNKGEGCLFDVIDGPSGADPSIRPNQIFAVSLPESPLDEEKQREVVSVCERELLTPVGLRSLSPRHVDYRGTYTGDPLTRDGRYHQGTVWGWLLGPFTLAHFRVHHNAEAALALLEPLRDHLSEAGLGSISEIFDGDWPHRPRGCIAQAWSVAETLRARQFLQARRVSDQTSSERRS